MLAAAPPETAFPLIIWCLARIPPSTALLPMTTPFVMSDSCGDWLGDRSATTEDDIPVLSAPEDEVDEEEEEEAEEDEVEEEVVVVVAVEAEGNFLQSWKSGTAYFSPEDVAPGP